jgi:hypothetical protein
MIMAKIILVFEVCLRFIFIIKTICQGVSLKTFFLLLMDLYSFLMSYNKKLNFNSLKNNRVEILKKVQLNATFLSTNKIT